MKILIRKAERRAAFVSFLGLAVFVIIVCSIQLSTHRHLPVREYLDDVALGSAFGAIGGAVFAYIAWLSVTSLQRLIGASVTGDTQVIPVEIEQA